MDAPDKRQYDWKVGCLAFMVLFVLSSYIVCRPALPQHLLREIEPGMTKAEVRKLLGEPQAIDSYDQWVYWHSGSFGNFGYVAVHFTDGLVVDYNDESAFPEP